MPSSPNVNSLGVSSTEEPKQSPWHSWQDNPASNQSSDKHQGGDFLHWTCSAENQSYGPDRARIMPQLDHGSYVSLVLVDPRGQDWGIGREIIFIALCWGHSLFAGTTSRIRWVCLLPPAHLGVVQQLQHSWTVAVGYFLRTWKILRIKQLMLPSWARPALQCGQIQKSTLYVIKIFSVKSQKII